MLRRLPLYLLLMTVLSSCVFVKINSPESFDFNTGESITFQGSTSSGIDQVRVSTPDGSSIDVNVSNKAFGFSLNFPSEIVDGELNLKALKNGEVKAESVYIINVRDNRPTVPDDMSVFGFSAPSNSDIEKELSLWATYYYLLIADAVNDGVPLRDLSGNKLGPEISKKNWCLGALEGSILVYDNGQAETYNYAGTSSEYNVDCSPYFDHTPSHRVKFRLANHPYGDGVRNYPLVPYRTIAVDPNVIPYGTVIYVPQARGVSLTLPDGTKVTHDGYFFAGDTGGLIKQNHIDVFYGINTSNPFSFVKSRESGTFKAYVVDPSNEAAFFLENIH